MAASTDPKSLPLQPKGSETLSISNAETTSTNPRGIPSFPFLPSVTDYVKTTAETEGVLTRFQEMISKYQFMQSNVERRTAGLREKLPEMKRTLDVVKFLRRQKARTTGEEGSEKADSGSDLENENEDEDTTTETKPIKTTFPLQDTLYAHATISAKTLSEVYLWLGANVMVSYPLAEAENLLQTKLDKARESLKAAEEDLEFLRVQITTLEVATARVHNWDVAEKRKLKLKTGDKNHDGDDEK